MGKVKFYVFFAIIYLSFLVSGFADAVILKTGQKVVGKIIEQTDKYVKLEFQGVELIYYKDEISYVEEGNSANSVTPQMEALYKAYTSSKKVKKDEVVQAPIEALQPEIKPAGQTAPVQQPTAAGASIPDLSKLSPEYQEKIKAALAILQTSGSKPEEKKE